MAAMKSARSQIFLRMYADLWRKDNVEEVIKSEVGKSDLSTPTPQVRLPDFRLSNLSPRDLNIPQRHVPLLALAHVAQLVSFPGIGALVLGFAAAFYSREEVFVVHLLDL